MNAKEQMELLLAGKILMSDGWQWRIGENGTLEARSAGNGWCWDESDGEELMFLDDNTVGSDGMMDFGHALGMMAQGMVMTNTARGDTRYRIADGVFQFTYGDRWATLSDGEFLDEEEMTALWSIVEGSE